MNENEEMENIKSDFELALKIVKLLEEHSLDTHNEDILKILKIVGSNYFFEVKRAER